MVGQGEEHVVEGGATQRQIVDAQIGGGQPRGELGEESGSVVDWEHDAARGDVHRRGRGPEPSQRAGKLARVLTLAGLELEAIAADAGLELIGGPARHDAALIDHDDRVGEAVGFLHVLGGE